MRQALTKVSFLPFAFSLELWRYEVLENKFNSSEYNDQWWEIRLFNINFFKMYKFVILFSSLNKFQETISRHNASCEQKFG